MNRIKELRTNKGIGQKDFAKILNVSQGTLSNWERSVHDPDSNTLFFLADYFNVSIDYLLYKTDNPTIKNIRKEEEEYTPKGIYFRLAKEAEAIGLDEEDINEILAVYKRHKERNK